jgi:ammonia channel protein AmtB
MPVLLSGITASVMQLLTSRADDALAKAGEGLVAGVVMTLTGQLGLEYALVAGIIAGFFVMRTEAITTALRIDDAQHLTGVLLVPALFGLLFAGMFGSTDIGAAIVWIGASCGLGCVIPLILWPLIKLTIGLGTR